MRNQEDPQKKTKQERSRSQRLHRTLVEICLLPVKFYRAAISPYIGPHCRFTPSCSTYCMEALREWGVLRGSFLALRRIFRCHPGGGRGYDPVPQNPKKHR